MKKYLSILLLSTQLFGGEMEPLVVGTTSGYAPYVSLDANGKYEGFDIDFAEALAQKMNRKLIIKDLGSMPSLLLALQQKKVDVVIWAVSITQEREEKMEMVYYQGEKVKEMPFLFWNAVPENIRSIEDLKDQTVSVEAGSFQEGVLRKYPQIRLKQVEKITDAVMEIRFGKSLAAMADPSIMTKLTTGYPAIQVVRLALKPEDQALGNGICIRKDNQQLAKQVKEATESLIQEGKVLELEKKWNMGG